MNKNNISLCGVYKITSKKFGWCYIGATDNLHKRKIQHFTALIRGNHNNINLQEHVRLFGIDDLEYNILLINKNKEDAFIDEKEFVKEYKPIWNIHTGLKYPLIHRGEACKHTIKSETYK